MNSDLTSVLHLTDIRGRALLTFYGLGTALVAILNLNQLIHPWQGIASLVLFGLLLLMLGWRGPTPFRLSQSVLVIVLVAVVAALSAWNLTDVKSPGYSGWYLGAMTVVLLVLGLRGRRAASWLGFGVLAALAIASSFGTGQTLFAAVNDVARQAGTLFIGTLFALVFRRAGNVIALIQQRELARAASEAATTAATIERATQNQRLEQHARPALERLLDDRPLSAEERAGMALLEAELRDGIRAAGFNREAIVEHTRSARERGVQVVLVDDRGSDLDDESLDRIEGALIAELREVQSGTVTARLSSFDSDELATIVVAQNGNYRSVKITTDAVEVTTLS